MKNKRVCDVLMKDYKDILFRLWFRSLGSVFEVSYVFLKLFVFDKKYSKYSIIAKFTSTFTFMRLADAFIQSDLQVIQVIHFFCQYVNICQNYYSLE